MIRPKIALALFFSTALILGISCHTPTIDLSRGPRTFGPENYQDVYENWSRDLHILPVDGIENVLTARGTYLGYEFRWAYVVRRAHDLRLSPLERQYLHDSEFRALEEQHEFFITSMSGVKNTDNLDPESGPWQIRLEDDRGRQVAPISITKIRKPPITDTTYFKYDPIHRTGYRIIFPRKAPDNQPILTPATQFFSLTFSSPLGQGNMRWKAK